MLRAKDLLKSFRQGLETTTILDKISHTFKQNVSYAITGVSGTGKSTLLYLLAGLERPDSGTVFFDDHDIFQLDSNARTAFLQKKRGLIFQSAYLINELSVLENVMLTGLIAGEGYKKEEEKAQLLLDKLGMIKKMNAFPHTLSGGEQQRVALARALFLEPAYIIADEPTAHLDKQTKKMVIDLLLSCKQERHIGLIVATHDEDLASEMQVCLTLEKGLLQEIPHAP